MDTGAVGAPEAACSNGDFNSGAALIAASNSLRVMSLVYKQGGANGNLVDIDAGPFLVLIYFQIPRSAFRRI